MRTLAVGLVLAVAVATAAAEPDPEIFEFDSAEKIDHLNETASSSDVETLSPVKTSDVKVKIEAKCLLPKAEGNGTDQIAVFHFDPKTQTCHPFNYTGSGGNDNIFLSELDCLSDCYLPVGEGTPEREEDVVIIGRSKRDNSEFPAANSFCRLPKDAGNGE
ncbi:papilin-like protein, partial [Aphelenchoides avenae]